MSLRNSETKHLRWPELSNEVRDALENRLRNLYGRADDESAFDALSIDKQQALLCFARRLTELKLWETVRRIENVYGEGGVGINFTAWPVLHTALSRHHSFTGIFAAHKDSSGGFIERRRTRSSLHFLYLERATRRWSAHFDLYNPLAFPLGTWQHLLHEKIKRETPDWIAIKCAL
jgi:hypothetical protein